MEARAGRRGRRRSREPGGTVRALERGLSLLEALSEASELSLSEIARRVRLPYSTTHRLLETLVRRRFVAQRGDTGLYRVGIRAFEVGAALAQARLHEVAHPEMKALVDEINETVNLAVLDGEEAVYIHQVEGRQVVRMFTHLGARVPLYASGVGKALLAWRPEEEVRALLGPGPLRGFTKRTLTAPAAVLKELRRVRVQGYALDAEEREPGVRCVAAPVRSQGEVVAALSLSAPATRLGDDRVARLARRLVAAAERVSAQLGPPGAQPGP